jgi:hypothetical protein
MSTLNVLDFTSFNQSTNYLSTGNLFADKLNTINITFQTLTGSIINTSIGTMSTLTVSSILNVSSINAASSITTQHLVFSSFCMEPTTTSSFVPAVSTFFSSIVICLNGGYWKIPITQA